MSNPILRAARRRLPQTAAVLAALALSLAVPAHADDAELQALKRQVEELQRKIDALAQAKAAPEKPGPATASFSAGPMNVTLGGFVELMAVNRSRNEAADWASNYNTGIPYPQSPNYQLSEFHLTERQSRFAALVQSPNDPNVAAEAYLEGDFGGAPSNGNNNESTSFAPRIRHFYADYARKDSGWYLLFGQTWSLATGNKSLINVRQEQIPLTIDGQYVPGFNWTRAPQIRLVKNFGKVAAFGLSVENPAMLLTAATSCTATAASGTVGTEDYVAANDCYNTLKSINYGPFYNTQGASSAFAGVITTDSAPDVIAKVAVDPGFGHYELFGILRTFRDRNSTFSGATIAHGNNSTTAGGGGASAILPLVPGKLELAVSALVGDGIGRYGSAQLPDATLKPDGTIVAVKGYDFLAGLTFKPTAMLTLYGYFGREHADRTAFTAASLATPTTSYGFGYGSPLFDNSNCLLESSSGKCAANTASITNGTIGGWWKFYQGPLGNMQFGAQLTNVKREVYAGLNGLDPSTSINVALLSLRYYPYQR